MHLYNIFIFSVPFRLFLSLTSEEEDGQRRRRDKVRHRHDRHGHGHNRHGPKHDTPVNDPPSTEPEPEPSVDCWKARQDATDANLNHNAYIPECNVDGTYKLMQCYEVNIRYI